MASVLLSVLRVFGASLGVVPPMPGGRGPQLPLPARTSSSPAVGSVKSSLVLGLRQHLLNATVFLLLDNSVSGQYLTSKIHTTCLETFEEGFYRVFIINDNVKKEAH